MFRYGALTQPKLVSHLLVPQAMAHESQDFSFSMGELAHCVINMETQLVGASLFLTLSAFSSCLIRFRILATFISSRSV